MTLDDRTFCELITESEDLHSDAMGQVRETLPQLVELREGRRGEEVDPEDVARYDAGRRRLLAGLGGGGLAAAVSLLLARPASAQTNVDVQMLQTASSLERLAVNTYGTALKLDFIAGGNPVIRTFAETTMRQHDEHLKAFQAQTEALGGKRQDRPNPKFLPVVEKAAPNFAAPLDVVMLATDLEEVATETYLTYLSLMRDGKSRELMSSVMGVEAQHMATLKAVAALLTAGDDSLIAIPVDPAALPRAAGNVAFPDATPTTDSRMIAEYSTGAVR